MLSLLSAFRSSVRFPGWSCLVWGRRSPAVCSLAECGALLFALSLVAGCQSDDTESTESQYNATDNAVDIVVGSVDILEPVTAMVTSSTGEVQIGELSVDPGGGPIGTIHQVRVEILEEYAGPVMRASIRTSSEGRGEDEYDLDQDSVGTGIWVLELQSVGEEGELRTDSLTLRLWEEG